MVVQVFCLKMSFRINGWGCTVVGGDLVDGGENEQREGKKKKSKR